MNVIRIAVIIKVINIGVLFGTAFPVSVKKYLIQWYMTNKTI